MQIKMPISIRPYLQKYLIEKLHKKFEIDCLQQMINYKHSHVKSSEVKSLPIGQQYFWRNTMCNELPSYNI